MSPGGPAAARRSSGAAISRLEGRPSVVLADGPKRLFEVLEIAITGMVATGFLRVLIRDFKMLFGLDLEFRLHRQELRNRLARARAEQALSKKSGPLPPEDIQTRRPPWRFREAVITDDEDEIERQG